jgi:hypothetical protein
MVGQDEVRKQTGGGFFFWCAVCSIPLRRLLNLKW